MDLLIIPQVIVNDFSGLHVEVITYKTNTQTYLGQLTTIRRIGMVPGVIFLNYTLAIWLDVSQWSCVCMLLA